MRVVGGMVTSVGICSCSCICESLDLERVTGGGRAYHEMQRSILCSTYRRVN